MSPILYYSLLVLCWLYAWFKGGPPERIGATILATGSVLSYAALSSVGRFQSVETGLLIVDVATLLAFLALALRAERFWPSWVTALQAVRIAGHAVMLVDSGTIPLAYAFIMALWGYPMLLLIALGTWRHQQRLKRLGVDRSWSSYSILSTDLPPPPGPMTS
jgi:hypothetical protein